MRDAITLKQPVKSVCNRIRGEAYDSPFYSAPLIGYEIRIINVSVTGIAFWGLYDPFTIAVDNHIFTYVNNISRNILGGQGAYFSAAHGTERRKQHREFHVGTGHRRKKLFYFRIRRDINLWAHFLRQSGIEGEIGAVNMHYGRYKSMTVVNDLENQMVRLQAAPEDDTLCIDL